MLSWFRRDTDAPASVSPATPSNEALASAHVTLESTLKAQAQHLLTASEALNYAAAQLLKAGKTSPANKVKQASLTARKHAEEWV